ncbi:MAG TPA: PDZ domain-containing protein [Pyrinomonadaceae bacterium]|nr:PDZ domain-containing protein [Pyrinomonadaceae bacterium]
MDLRRIMAQKFRNATLAIVALSLAILFMQHDVTAQKKQKKQKEKPATTALAAAPPEIAFTVGMSKPWTHLLEVQVSVKWDQMPEALDLKMPVWTPGSYLIREYARHVQDFDVKNGAGGDLAWQKTSKNTWTVKTNGAKEIKATYRVYANELTVRTNEVNSEHAFWNNAATLMFVKGQLAAPSTITVNPYGDWKIATGLPQAAGSKNTFKAPNFDVLFDSPFEVSNFTEFDFTVEGKPHRLVFSGEGNYDGPEIAAEVTKIVEQAYKIFGELPYENYTFIVNLRGGGGLEHLNSTALQFNRWGFKPQARLTGFLGLVAHEYFHAFNVKRIRPDALGPFDYENENYTRLLWVAEGGTEYYSGLLLLRAGLISPQEYLAGKADSIRRLEAIPGRFEQSLEYSSFDAWIKYYRQDENSMNNQISYYDKGELVNMMLDLKIREASNGTKSLDDVMRALYNDFYKKGKNYTPADYQHLAEVAAGVSLDDFFSKYVRGTAEVDWNSFLNGIGLEIKKSGGGKPYLGAQLTEANGNLTVRAIPAGSPAYEQGLNTGDQIVAVDGYRATNSFLSTWTANKKVGDKIKLTIFRFDKLRDIEITLGADPQKMYSISQLANPTAEQQTLEKQYLNAAQ